MDARAKGGKTKTCAESWPHEAANSEGVVVWLAKLAGLLGGSIGVCIE